MQELIVTIHRSWLTIDGPLPDGYRLIVHNHSGHPDFYPHSGESRSCDYVAGWGDDEYGMDGDVPCYLYVEERAPSVSP